MFNLCGRTVQSRRLDCSVFAVRLFNSKRSGCSTWAEYSYGVAKSSCEVLKNVWQSAFLQKKKEHCYEMTDEMFYFYHIAHMAKHFEEGGCGIRPFIDLWTLDNIKDVDHDKRDELLSQGNLNTSHKTEHLGRTD